MFGRGGVGGEPLGDEGWVMGRSGRIDICKRTYPVLERFGCCGAFVRVSIKESLYEVFR